MSRSFFSEAIILKTRPAGEIHASLSILTEDHGVLQVIAHGARSAHGSLRSACQGLNAGLAHCYHDPVKQSYKLSEFTVQHQFEAIKADLDRYLYATLWLDLFLRVHQDAAWEYQLLRSALLALEAGGGPVAVSVQVLMRHLAQSGIGPDPTSDARTGAPLSPQAVTSLSAHEGGFVAIPNNDSPNFVIDPGARQYYTHTLSLPLAEAGRVGLPVSSLSLLHSALLTFAEAHFNVQLVSRAMLPNH